VLHGLMLGMNHRVNNVRRALGRPYWPLAERLKLSIGTSLRYIEQFEQLAAAHAARCGYDGVVCGHIHRANLRHIGATLYCNTGDWVESCSALIETARGQLELLRWPGPRPAAARTRSEPLADAA